MATVRYGVSGQDYFADCESEEYAEWLVKALRRDGYENVEVI